MGINFLQWIGYSASIIIAVSMMMSSIVKFRWINMLGAMLFCIYGFIISAIPVVILNGMIVVVDIYYILIIYTKKEIFEILEIKAENEYLDRFLKYHNEDIQKICRGFSYKPEMNTVSFFILRNMSVVGLFLAHKKEGNVLSVGLDYAIPEYRDIKNGKFVYFRLKQTFIEAGFTKIRSEENNMKNVKYFKKLGFVKDENGFYTKNL